MEGLLYEMRSHNYELAVVMLAVLAVAFRRGAVQLYVSISTSLLLKIDREHSPSAARICEIFGCSAISPVLL